MATLAISASTSRNTPRQPVEILPRQPVASVAISSAPSLASFHHQLPPVPPEFTTFPENVFDFEELVEVDELLTELGMSPPTTGYAEDDGVVMEAHDDHFQEALLPPFQTTTASDLPPADAAPETSTTTTTTAPGGVIRTVSMDQVSFADSISNSVPNPMRNIPLDDEPPTKKQKFYAPLLPNPSTPPTAPATIHTTAAIQINKPVTTTTTSTTIKKITTTKPKAAIAKSSSIPTLLPAGYLPSTPTSTTTPIAVVPASNGRKRKLSRKEAELNMSAEELEERRERNRSHAKKSRQRKKAMTELLQESVQSLQQANQILREGLNASLGPQFAENYLQSREDQQKDAFLKALMDPQNRKVDAVGLAFLKKLQKRIPKGNAGTAAIMDDDEAAF